MACCQPGNKPLSETMMLSLLTYICVTRPQWVNMLNCLCRKLLLIPISKQKHIFMFRQSNLAHKGLTDIPGACMERVKKLMVKRSVTARLYSVFQSYSWSVALKKNSPQVSALHKRRNDCVDRVVLRRSFSNVQIVEFRGQFQYLI